MHSSRSLIVSLPENVDLFTSYFPSLHFLFSNSNESVPKYFLVFTLRSPTDFINSRTKTSWTPQFRLDWTLDACCSRIYLSVDEAGEVVLTNSPALAGLSHSTSFRSP
jgi:hypothetical protein